MKKEYTHPETTIIELRAEQALLVGSVYGDSPVTDAIEGDTNDWGIWCG